MSEVSCTYHLSWTLCSPFPLFCSMLQKRFRSRDGFPPLCKYIIWLEARQERCNLAQNFVISGRSRIEVAITDVAQSRHTRVRYKGFRGDRRPPLSVYIQLWPLSSIQLIICLGSPSPNLFTQLFTQGTRPVFHAGKSLKATHVSSHLEELLSDGRKNHQRKDASKVMHLQSTKCFAMWTEILNVSIYIFCETENLTRRNLSVKEKKKKSPFFCFSSPPCCCWKPGLCSWVRACNGIEFWAFF